MIASVNHLLSDTTLVITALGAMAVAIYSIWRYMLVPMWRFFRAIADLSDVMPVLLEIAHEFKPNDGSSLRDVIDGNGLKLDSISDQVSHNTIRLSNIEGQLENSLLGRPLE